MGRYKNKRDDEELPSTDRDRSGRTVQVINYYKFFIVRVLAGEFTRGQQIASDTPIITTLQLKEGSWWVDEVGWREGVSLLYPHKMLINFHLCIKGSSLIIPSSLLLRLKDFLSHLVHLAVFYRISVQVPIKILPLPRSSLPSSCSLAASQLAADKACPLKDTPPTIRIINKSQAASLIRWPLPLRRVFRIIAVDIF